MPDSKIYLVIQETTQTAYVDKHGEVAAPSREIMGARTTKEAAERLCAQLQISHAAESIESAETTTFFVDPVPLNPTQRPLPRI